MKETLDQAICIFPFEKEWYLSQGLVVDFIGHPFIDKARNEDNSNNFIVKKICANLYDACNDMWDGLC